ncbi:MAG: hypothetical protein PVG79_05775, partial [Gemmatimonadales bacterium]
QRTEIEGHLATCEECRARLDAADALSGRAADLLAELEPGAVQAPSWREIEERAAARRLDAPRRVLLRPSLAWAASIALAFAIGWASRGLWLTMPAFEAPPRSTAVGAIEADRSDTPELRQRSSAETGEAQPEGARLEEPRPTEPDLGAAQPRAKSTPDAEAATEAAGRAQPAEVTPAQPKSDDRPAEANEQIRAAEVGDELVVVQTPPAVAGIEAHERAAGEAAAPVSVDRALPEPTAYAVELRRTLAQISDSTAELSGFFEVPPEEATLWLGTELRTLPELALERVQVGPGAAVAGGQSGLPAIRLVYKDAAGNEIVLTQQWVGDLGTAVSETEGLMVIEPSGHREYRWLDGRGYLLILAGAVSGDSLRALAERLE